MTPPTTAQDWYRVARELEADAANAERLHHFGLAKLYREQAAKARAKADELAAGGVS